MGLAVAGGTHFQGDALFPNQLHHSFILHAANAMANTFCSSLNRRAYTLRPICLPGMHGVRNSGLFRFFEQAKIIHSRKQRLRSGQIHGCYTVILHQVFLRQSQRLLICLFIALAAHAAQDQIARNRSIFQSCNCRLHRLLLGHAAKGMKLRRKAQLRIDHTVLCHIFQHQGHCILQPLRRLHQASRQFKALQKVI